MEFDVDAMMRTIRDEVVHRKAVAATGLTASTGSASKSGSKIAPGSAVAAPPIALTRLPDPGGRLEPKDRYALADFLQFHDEVFVRNAYLGILGRPPDATGFAAFLEALRGGRLAKVEILGRMRFSREGRSVGVAVERLWLPFALRTLRRAPVIGRMVGILQYVIRLPDIARNHERLEAVVFHRQLEMNRHINAVEAQIEVAVTALGQRAIDAQNREGAAQQAISEIAERIRAAEARLAPLVESITSLRKRHERHVEETASALGELGTAIAQIDERKAGRDTIERALALLAAGKSDLDNLRDTVEERVQGLSDELHASLAEIGTRIARMQREVESNIASSNVQRLTKAASDLELARIASVLQSLELGSREHQGSVVPFPRAHAARDVADELAPGAQEPAMDAFYLAFENQFRGTMEDIHSRLAVYLPVVKAAGIGTGSAPLIDLGSGRGEWLQLVKEQGFAALGVDQNTAMAELCRRQGLDVVVADAVGYLQSLPSQSVGGITAFHLVEHVSFAELLALFDESLRVLQPGGLVIFETPNPENLIVGACNFYIDPTHQRPLPPAMLSFVAQARGFKDVEIMRLHPHADSARIVDDGGELEARVNMLLYGPQDYAVIGRKSRQDA